MKLSMQATIAIAAVFAMVCLGVGINGLMSLDGITDPTQLEDAKGFAWFWTFLGGVGVLLGVLAWWIARDYKEDEDA